jgi:TRAP-type C4-dicarboxylate transport system substrate-binding protein
MALSIPRLIRTGEELDYVLEQVGPDIAAEMEQEGFILLDWAKTGWIYFFTREPAASPEELKPQDLASPGGEKTALTNAFKYLGFDVVTLSSTDVFSGLASGMVDSIFGNPIYVAANQWFGIADHMTDFPIAPFLGGFVISARAWRRIPDELKPELEAAVERVADRLDSRVLELEQEVIQTMQERGLTLVEVPEDAVPAWEREFEKGISYMAEREFSGDFVERIREVLNEYRRSREGN